MKITNFAGAGYICNFLRKSDRLFADKSYVISALDDEIVPHLFSDRLAQYLQADYIRLAQGGHFIDRDGITELPILLELLKQILK
ncbi:alpha/beta hydrolase superfamily esterase [Actinobacillus equuli]|nr:alpha/beta hydrolase superfamily esterase [Actinobacillus equuli]